MKLRVSEFDTETTGLKPGSCYILSLGFIHNVFDLTENKDKKLNVTNEKEVRFYNLINWRLLEDSSFKNFSIPQATIDVHGITDEEMVKNGIHPLIAFNNLYKSFFDFENENGRLDIICAFNLPFDVNMMRSNIIFLLNFYLKSEHCVQNNEFIYNGETYDMTELLSNLQKLLDLFTKHTKKDGLRTVVDEEKSNSYVYFIDSLIIDRIFHYMDDDFNKIRHNLEDVGLRYGLGENKDAHNAMGDTIRLVDVFRYQIAECHDKGITVNSKDFENRLVNKYINECKRFEKEQLDYFGENIK